MKLIAEHRGYDIVIEKPDEANELVLCFVSPPWSKESYKSMWFMSTEKVLGAVKGLIDVECEYGLHFFRYFVGAA